MSYKKLNPIFAVVGISTFAFSLWAVFVYDHRNDRPKKPEPRFEELEIRGNEQVTLAGNGESVTVSGFIDTKAFCHAHGSGRPDICETWLIGSSSENNFLPVRIRYCSESLRSNCLHAPLKDPIDFRDVYVLDNSGEVIDFDGEKLIEPPNTWTSESKRIRVTGRVSRVNGVGRFIEPIFKIEAEPHLGKR
jgi:hypothetical protein